MSRVLVGWQTDVAHEVGRVTSGSEYTFPIHSQINRRLVDVLLNLVYGLDGDEPNHRTHCEENLGIRFSDNKVFWVPLEALHVHAHDIDSVLGTLSLSVRDDFVVQVHGVNGDLELTGVVLFGTCQESVSEEEHVDPEDARNSVVQPVIEERKSCIQVLDVAAQRLK